MMRRRSLGLAWSTAVPVLILGCRPDAAPSIPPPAADMFDMELPEATDEAMDDVDEEPAPATASRPAAPSTVIDDWPWKAPYCFAYSPRTASYACVNLYAEPADQSAEDPDVSSGSIFDTQDGVQAMGAALELGVGFVSAHGRGVHMVIDTVSPGGFHELESLADVRERLRRRGFTETIKDRAELPEDTWVDVGRVQLRYSVHLHEGDASFEYSGTLEIRCGRKAPAQTIEFDPNDDLGGPFAVVASAPKTSLHAITVEHQDGGEGYVDVSWSSWLVDEQEWCPS